MKVIGLLLGIVLVAAACGGGAATSAPAAPGPQPVQSAPRVVQPGAPGQPSTTTAARQAAPKHTAADTAFMQGMIGHHAQALEMVALLKTRTDSQNMKLMGMRIEVSQRDEIRMMQEWLRARGETAPEVVQPGAAASEKAANDAHAMHMAGGKLMPGMLTPEQMARLAAARATEFDKLFLELMIQHHEGALVMVRELMSSPGSGQDANLFAFASDVEADQSAEIYRMRVMRGAMK